jgi:hypothetical protein
VHVSVAAGKEPHRRLARDTRKARNCEARAPAPETECTPALPCEPTRATRPAATRKHLRGIYLPSAGTYASPQNNTAWHSTNVNTRKSIPRPAPEMGPLSEPKSATKKVRPHSGASGFGFVFWGRLAAPETGPGGNVQQSALFHAMLNMCYNVKVQHVSVMLGVTSHASTYSSPNITHDRSCMFAKRTSASPGPHCSEELSSHAHT